MSKSITLIEGEPNGVKYVRESWMGDSVWYSDENGIVTGTVRLIDGILCYAAIVSTKPLFGKSHINWHPVKEKQKINKDE